MSVALRGRPLALHADVVRVGGPHECGARRSAAKCRARAVRSARGEHEPAGARRETARPVDPARRDACAMQRRRAQPQRRLLQQRAQRGAPRRGMGAHQRQERVQPCAQAIEPRRVLASALGEHARARAVVAQRTHDPVRRRRRALRGAVKTGSQTERHDEGNSLVVWPLSGRECQNGRCAARVEPIVPKASVRRCPRELAGMSRLQGLRDARKSR